MRPQRRYRDIADRAAAKYEEASAKIEEKVDQYKGRTSSTMGDVTSSSGFPNA